MTPDAAAGAVPAPAGPGPVELACLDMAGTVVRDDGMVLRAFEAAMRAVGMSPEQAADSMPHVQRTMGLPKGEVFRMLLGGAGRAADAVAAFDASVLRAVADGLVREVPGASAAMAALRRAGIRVCLTTGFTADVQDAIIRGLGWEAAVDLALAPGDGVRGRPHPDLVLTAVMRLGIDDVRRVAVVGDTANDLLAGHRAGASFVVGVLTGSHGGDELRSVPHTHIVGSVAAVPALLGV